MKKLLALFLLLFPMFAFAQSTAVTATITDSDGQTWNNGSFNITFVPVPGKPGPYFLDGQPFTPQVYNGSLSNTGVLNVTLPSNDHITPSGSKWQFVIIPDASADAFSVPLSIVGASLDLTSTLSALAIGPRFPASLNAYGYLDLEVTPIPPPGGSYFNVTSKLVRVWDGTQWINSFTAGSVVFNPLGSQTITQPPGTNFNVNTSGGGTFNYNGSEVLSRATGVQTTPTTSQTVTQPIGTTLGVNSLNGVLEATLFSGIDIGAKINAAYAALPTSGGLITVQIPPSGLSFTTPIVIGTANKPAIIDCRVNTGASGTSTVPTIQFTPSTGSALTFNISGTGNSHQRGYGTRNCSFTVSGTATALTIGGVNGGEGFEDDNSSFYASGTTSTAVTIIDNAWDITFNHSILVSNGGQLLNITAHTNAGEQISFNGVFFEGAGQNAILLQGGGLQFNCNDCSIDDSQLVANAALVVFKSPHFENPGGAISWPFVRANGNFYMSSPQLFQDQAGTTAPSFISIEGGNTTIVGITTASNLYAYPALFSISNNANLYSIAPEAILGIGNTFISGTTTGRYYIDTGNTCPQGPCQLFLSNTPVMYNAPSINATTDTFARTGSYMVGTGANPYFGSVGTGNNIDYYHSKVLLFPQFSGNGCLGIGSSGLAFYTENKSGGGSDISTIQASVDCIGNMHTGGHYFSGNPTGGTPIPESGAGVATQVVCYVSAGTSSVPPILGHCTSAVGAGGACTCTP